MEDYIVIRVTKEQAEILVDVLHESRCNSLKNIIKKAIQLQKSPLKERLIQNDKKKI